MIKRRTLIRMTRLWLALYIMTWCMTFTASDVALASSLPENHDVLFFSMKNGSYGEVGDKILEGYIFVNNGSVALNNVTVIFVNKDGGVVYRNGSVINDFQIIYDDAINEAVYKQGDNGTIIINRARFVDNKNGNGGQAIDPGAVETLDELENRTSYRNYSVRERLDPQETETQVFIGEDLYRILSDWIGDDPVDVWKIGELEPGEAATIVVERTVPPQDIPEVVNNTVYVARNGTDGPSYTNLSEIIWTSDPIIISIDDPINKDIKIHNGTSIGYLPTPEREGYEFVGWFTAPEGGNQVRWNTVFNASIKLYARWVKKEQPVPVLPVVPQTGDKLNIWPYVGIGILAVVGIVLILRRRKK